MPVCRSYIAAAAEDLKHLIPNLPAEDKVMYRRLSSAPPEPPPRTRTHTRIAP